MSKKYIATESTYSAAAEVKAMGITLIRGYDDNLKTEVQLRMKSIGLNTDNIVVRELTDLKGEDLRIAAFYTDAKVNDFSDGELADYYSSLIKSKEKERKAKEKLEKAKDKKAQTEFYVTDILKPFENYENCIILSYYANNAPSSVLKWADTGELVISEYGFKEHGEYTETGRRVIAPINYKNFELSKDKDNQIYVREFKTNIFLSAEDYVAYLHIGMGNKALALQALQLLPQNGKRPLGLEMYEDNGYFVMPRRQDMYFSNTQAKIMADEFVPSDDFNFLVAKDKEIWDSITGKQKLDYIAAIGIPMLNIIIEQKKLDMLKPLIELYGATGAGKSWIQKIAVREWWGLLNKDSLLVGTTLTNSLYRYHTSMDSTNLPLIVEEIGHINEAVIDSIKAGTGGAGTYRGTGEVGRNKQYRARATLLGNAQHDVFNGIGSLADELALDRRLYKNYYTGSDVKDRKGEYEHDELLNSIKQGGLIYHYLKRYDSASLEKIVKIYYKFTNSPILTGLLLGLGLSGRLNAKDMETLVWNYDKSDLLESKLIMIMKDVAVMEAGTEVYVTQNGENTRKDAKTKELETMLKVEIDETTEEEVVLIGASYIHWINASKSHPLCGKFNDLGDLKELAPLLDKDWLPERIYDKSKVTRRINGSNMRYAKLPKDAKCNTSVAVSVAQVLQDIIIDKLDKLDDATLATLFYQLKSWPAFDFMPLYVKAQNSPSVAGKKWANLYRQTNATPASSELLQPPLNSKTILETPPEQSKKDAPCPDCKIMFKQMVFDTHKDPAELICLDCYNQKYPVSQDEALPDG